MITHENKNIHPSVIKQIKLNIIIIMNKDIETWTLLTNQIKQLNAKLYEMRNQRNICEQNIIRQQQQLSSKYKIIQSNTYEPLTFKYLELTLGKIISNHDHVQAICLKLRQHRTVQTTNKLIQI